MKAIDITDEHIREIFHRVHRLTEIDSIERTGILGLNFNESFRKYGSAEIVVKHFTVDRFDGSNYCEFYFVIVLHHTSVWFKELNYEKENSGYNKNHIFGYDKLRELGYELPSEPQWT